MRDFKLYKIELEGTTSFKTIVEYEYAETEMEALEMVLGRNGTAFKVKQVDPADAGMMLEGAH